MVLHLHMAKIYDSTNFHKHTFCVFKELPLGAISSLNVNYKSKSGSSYYFTKKGVFRLSNHWGRAANCKWRLQNIGFPSNGRTKLGYANWVDFHPDNNTEKLYFIEADYDLGVVHYEHKNAAITDSQSVLRTASETEKIIKQIRHLFHTDGWAKHYSMEINLLRRKITQQLIDSTKTLQQIKSELDSR